MFYVTESVIWLFTLVGNAFKDSPGSTVGPDRTTNANTINKITIKTNRIVENNELRLTTVNTYRCIGAGV